MARHNLVFLLGYVTFIQVYDSSGGEPYALVYITVARAQRNAGDHKDHLKLDSPLIMSRDPEILKEISEWEMNDIVEIKGTIAARTANKGSFCPHCSQKNRKEGVVVYVNPIFARKREHFESSDECLQYLAANREISNQVFVFGTLCTDPKKITPKEGLVITQYQVALNRKYRIASDPPELRSDYPWVKSYGENAMQDRIHLHIGSQIFIDGCLQARKVNRHAVCEYCGEKYDWADRAMEIVPFENEYISNYYTQEEYEERKKKEQDDAVTNVLGTLVGYQMQDNTKDDRYSEEEIKAGIESEEEG